MTRPDPPGIHAYRHPAGGWDALEAVAAHLHRQRVIKIGTATLLHSNQPDGFDCPGCAWPDASHTSTFEFCENGAKAVAWEATALRVTRQFFEDNDVASLRARSDHWLESQGRLTEPMAYEPRTDRFVPIAWEDAFRRVAAALHAIDRPDQAEFYTSGRASNEAAFLYQLFARAFGTNNFPDCSNLCHEPTSVGLPRSLGVGKGTVTLDDFDECDAIFSFGHNPGTNHPRMMTTLRSAARRGARIVTFNPMRERSLERFAAPQDPVEMVTLSSTAISTQYHQVRVGGDVAALKGLAKAVFALDDDARCAGMPRVLDVDFIQAHCLGFEAFEADIRATAWQDIEGESGLPHASLAQAAEVYASSRAVIATYGMGITQHRTGTANVRMLTNLLLMRGNIGRPGAGICPLRGHSNVQGNRSVGITERPKPELLDALARVFSFTPPRAAGHSVVEAIEAMRDGRARVLVSLGGNFAQAAPDPAATHAALRKLDLVVGIHTKLNRSHLVFGKDCLILPCLGRTESDLQENGAQSITVEDSMSMVHASRGFNEPASLLLRSEVAIVAGIAHATLGPRPIDWAWHVADYGRIRQRMEQVLPTFVGYDERIREPGGFRLPNGARERVWNTDSGKAEFFVFPGLVEDMRLAGRDVLRLTTVRSHDQYNTTIYGLDDRYRGVFGRRDVLFMNVEDVARLGLASGDRVRVTRARATPLESACELTVVAHAIAAGCCAAYFPEANGLVDLGDRDPDSLTPAYKSIAVRVVPIAGDR